MYHSPFHLIDPAVFEAGDDAVALKRRLGLEKRKLLAEFELVGTPTIILHGRELQRQDVSDLFDEFQDSARLSLHLSIWTHKAFLQFLESGQPGGEGDWLYPPGTEDGDNLLLRFVSPFYAEALNRYLQRCLLNQDDPRSLLYELRADDWLLPTDNDNAYRYVTRFFTEKKNELLNIRYRSEQRQPVDASELRSWCNDQQIHVLNRLPDQFDDLRYRLAERLNNLCVLYDRQQAKKLALAAIERAATIRVNDEELERLVPANLRIIRNKNGATLMQVDPDTGKRRVRMLPVILILVLLARIVGAGVGCFRESAPDTASTIRYEQQQQPDRTPQEASFGALIAALASPAADTSSDTAAIRLARPRATGDNPFAALFPAMTSGASTIRERVAALGYDSSTLLLRNKSVLEAIFLLQVGAGAMRSIYIRPGDEFALRYPPVPIAVQLYAGRDWNDSLRNSYLLHTGQSSSRQQSFRGGFRTRVPVAGEPDNNDVPMFARNPPEQGTQDTLSVSSGPAGLTVFYDLGAD